MSEQKSHQTSDISHQRKNAASIFILIDALGWNYIKNRPFLDDIAVTKMSVKSILGFSSGVIPSILTGKYPQEHKHWSLYFYSPETSPFRWTKVINWLPKRFLNSRVMRKVVEEISKRVMGYTGYFETYLIPVEQLYLYDISEKKNIYEPRGIRNSGSIFDKLEENQVDYKCYHYPLRDEEIFRRAQIDLEQADSSFYFLYLSESDSMLHKSCNNKAEVDVMICHYESKIRKLYQLALGKYEKVNLYMFSDHGMCCVKESYDLRKEIDELELEIGIDYIPFYDSTMARFWFFNEKAKEKINSFLKTKEYGRILANSELESLGINFNDNMYGEMIFLMKPEKVINPSYMGNKMPVGMHGYSVEDSSMDAMLVSNCVIKEKIKDVKDFFELMVEGLSLKERLLRPASGGTRNDTVNGGRPLPSTALRTSQGQSPIKILYFLNSIARGGVEEHVLGLLKNIDKSKFEAILVCPQQLVDLLKKELEEIKVKYYAGDIRKWTSLWEVSKFIKILRVEKPDIVNAHLFGATKFAAPIAKFCRVPVVIETAHLREAWRKGLKKAYFVDRFFYRYVDRIIAVSNAVKNYLVSTKKLEAAKITVIHNGVDLRRFRLLRPERDGTRNDTQKKFTIGVIGRLEPQKGHIYLLEAVALLNGKLANIEFQVIGEGSLTDSLKLKVKDLKLEDTVKFIGFKNDIVSVLRELDAVILPSLFEGFPLTVLEAGAMGKAVIATNVDGTPEAIINNRTGVLVPPADNQALKAAISLFLDNHDMVVELGLNAYNHITANFSLAKQIEKTEQNYLIKMEKHSV